MFELNLESASVDPSSVRDSQPPIAVAGFVLAQIADEWRYWEKWSLALAVAFEKGRLTRVALARRCGNVNFWNAGDDALAMSSAEV